MFDPRFEAGTPFSDADIGKIERVVGRSLPKDYCDFVQEYGGAFVGGFVYGSEDLPILNFLGASGETGVLSYLNMYPDLRDERALPIADCELGNLYVLDQENTVCYINYYGGNTVARKVSDSFDEFLAHIVVPDD